MSLASRLAKMESVAMPAAPEKVRRFIVDERDLGDADLGDYMHNVRGITDYGGPGFFDIVAKVVHPKPR